MFYRILIRMILRICILVYLFSVPSRAEVVNTAVKGDRVSPELILKWTDMFRHVTPECSEDPQVAYNNTDEVWNSLSLKDKGDYIWKVSENLAELHGFEYSPRTMTCKVFMESTFRPLIKAETSTSCGLSQVTEETGWLDVIDQAGYQTKIPGQKPITSLEEYKKRIRTSMMFQLEIGMLTLERKRVDFLKQKEFNIRPALEYYRGADEATNKLYADKIIRCANCMKANSNAVSEECLNCTSAKGYEDCEKYKYAK